MFSGTFWSKALSKWAATNPRKTAPRPGIGSVARASSERVRALGTRVRNYGEELLFGKREVQRFVKGRSRYMTNRAETELESGGAAADAVLLFETRQKFAKHAGVTSRSLQSI
jgi:hypothetical protein